MAAVVGSAQSRPVSSDSLPGATGKLPLSWVVVQTLALPTEEDCLVPGLPLSWAVVQTLALPMEEDCLVPGPASCPQFSMCLGEAVWNILPPPMVG